MAFISNKQRNKNVKSINKGIALKKWIIFTVITAGIAFAVLTILMLVQDFGLIHWSWLNLGLSPNDEGGGGNPPLPIDENGNLTITTFAYIYLVLAAFEILFGIIALILVLTLKSPKTIASKTAFLAKSAISGKKKSEATTKQRVSKAKK